MSKKPANLRVLAAARSQYKDILEAHSRLKSLSFPLIINKSFDEITRAWISYVRSCVALISKLNYLQEQDKKVFKKYVEMHCPDNQYTDELLCYIKVCRDEKDHGLQIDLTHEKAPSVSLITAVPPWELPEGGLAAHPEYISGTIINPGDVRLVPITIKIKGRGKQRTFPVPTHHLGQSISIRSPLLAADAAASFYDNLMKEIESKLPEPSADKTD